MSQQQQPPYGYAPPRERGRGRGRGYIQTQPTSEHPYWIDGEGIDHQVIQLDIQRYLGNDAVIKKGMKDGRDGYWYNGYRALTSKMEASIRENSYDWYQERTDYYQQTRQDGPAYHISETLRHSRGHIHDDDPSHSNQFASHPIQPPTISMAPPQQSLHTDRVVLEYTPHYDTSSGGRHPPSHLSYPEHGDADRVPIGYSDPRIYNQGGVPRRYEEDMTHRQMRPEMGESGQVEAAVPRTDTAHIPQSLHPSTDEDARFRPAAAPLNLERGNPGGIRAPPGALPVRHTIPESPPGQSVAGQWHRNEDGTMSFYPIHSRETRN